MIVLFMMYTRKACDTSRHSFRMLTDIICHKIPCLCSFPLCVLLVGKYQNSTGQSGHVSPKSHSMDDKQSHIKAYL